MTGAASVQQYMLLEARVTDLEARLDVEVSLRQSAEVDGHQTTASTALPFTPDEAFKASTARIEKLEKELTRQRLMAADFERPGHSNMECGPGQLDNNENSVDSDGNNSGKHRRCNHETGNNCEVKSSLIPGAANNSGIATMAGTSHPLKEYLRQLEDATGISDEDDLISCLEDFTNDAISWIAVAQAFKHVAASDSYTKETFHRDDDSPRGIFYRKTHRVKNGSDAIGLVEITSQLLQFQEFASFSLQPRESAKLMKNLSTQIMECDQRIQHIHKHVQSFRYQGFRA